MGQIKVLDEHIVNMIAAGEVIERPASVVKELLENSIDAKATRITVAVEDGGRRLISVTDNGCGMDGEDLEKAFESHCTSKVRTASDLHSISTLGFRGEALASIASVAQVKAVSRAKDCLSANCVEIDCGKKGRASPVSADFGTTIQVRDIFYKLPARRKFLRTANTEMSHISEQFTRIALAHTEMEMVLMHNGKELYRLSAKEDLQQRIAALFSPEIADNLITTETREKQSLILALLGKPGISRTTNKYQYTFLNKRSIRDKFISHAVREAYRGSLEPDRFGVVFLYIEMPFEDYDVNVHPTKTEVKFYNPNLVHSQILGCLRERLLAANLDVEVKWRKPCGAPPAADQRSLKINDAMADFFRKYGPTQQSQHQFGFGPTGGVGAARVPGQRYPEQTNRAEHAPAGPLMQRKFLQIHDSFIVTETEEGFIIIDQHALHERIMYEHLRKRIADGRLQSQKLLIPESFEPTNAQADTIQTNAELIDRLGIELAPFGPRTTAVQAFPMLLAKVDPVGFVRDLLDLMDGRNSATQTDELLEDVLNMAACKAAIKAGQKLSDSEIEQLLADRQTVQTASRCPHGRPAVIKFSISDLEKQFKRT